MQENPIFEVELWTLLNCQPFQQSWEAALLSLLRYAPSVVTLIVFAVGVRYSEIYLIWFGFGLWGSDLLNWLLNLIIARPPRVVTCLPIFGAAIARQVQYVAFFTAFAFMYVSLFRPRIRLWQLLIVVLFYFFTIIAMHLLNYDFNDAILSGAALGTLLALAYQSFLYFTVIPTFEIQLRSRLLRWWGAQDTLCRGETTPPRVIVLEHFDAKFPATQPTLSRSDVYTFIAGQDY